MGNGWLDKAKDAASKAQDVARKGAEQAKDTSQKVMLRRKLDGAAEELGHIVFRQREGEGGLDAEIDRLVGEMRGLRAEIDAVED